MFQAPRPSASFHPAATETATDSDAAVASSDDAADATGIHMPVSSMTACSAALSVSTAEPSASAEDAAVGPLPPPASQHTQAPLNATPVPRQQQTLRPPLSQKQPSVPNWTPPALHSQQQDAEGNLLATTMAGYTAVLGVRFTPTHTLAISFDGHFFVQTELLGHTRALIPALSLSLSRHHCMSALAMTLKAVIPCMHARQNICKNPRCMCMPG